MILIQVGYGAHKVGTQNSRGDFFIVDLALEVRNWSKEPKEKEQKSEKYSLIACSNSVMKGFWHIIDRSNNARRADISQVPCC